MRILFCLSAVLAGVGASWWSTGHTLADGTKAPDTTSIVASVSSLWVSWTEDPSDADADPQVSLQPGPAAPQAGARLFRAGDVAFTRHTDAHGEFIGYRVTSAPTDSLLEPESIVTGIDGHQVEDTAAGSELLLVALQHRTDSLTILSPAAVR